MYQSLVILYVNGERAADPAQMRTEFVNVIWRGAIRMEALKARRGLLF